MLFIHRYSDAVHTDLKVDANQFLISFPGSKALFEGIMGFIQVNATVVIATDTINDCLRRINLQTGQTAAFAGTCRGSGYLDGKLLNDARFNDPYGIVSFKDDYYITDSRNNAIRVIEEQRDWVSTIISGSRHLVDPLAITFNPFSTNDVALVTTFSKGLYSVNMKTNSVTQLTNRVGETGTLSASKLPDPRSMTFISDSVVVIAVPNLGQLAIIDLTRNDISYICDGTRATRNGDIRSCQLKNPFSVMEIKDSLYIAQLEGIRRLPLTALAEFIQPPTTTTSSTPTTIKYGNYGKIDWGPTRMIYVAIGGGLPK